MNWFKNYVETDMEKKKCLLIIGPDIVHFVLNLHIFPQTIMNKLTKFY